LCILYILYESGCGGGDLVLWCRLPPRQLSGAGSSATLMSLARECYTAADYVAAVDHTQAPNMDAIITPDVLPCREAAFLLSADVAQLLSAHQQQQSVTCIYYNPGDSMHACSYMLLVHIDQYIYSISQ
jgi:hypothetical protein